MNALRARFLRHVAQTSEAPLALEIERASGSTVFDRAGKEYLDFLAGMGVANVGHCHPEVVDAVRAQAGRYLHAMVYGEYVQEPQVRLAARLAELLPGALSTAYFTNSGAEAIEGALKTARKHTRRTKLVAFEGAFHGDTLGALSICGNPLYREPFAPLLPDVLRLPFADRAALERIDAETAGVVIEPVQGEGGVRIPPADYLEALRRRTREVGALLVFDEVLTGFGRTGTLFAFERFGVVPDVLVIAKALGGGLPLGAFVSSAEILGTLAVDPPLGHVTTFGGHPVSCAAGLAALDVLLRDRLAERAERLGERLRSKLRSLAWQGHLVEVRGLGLLVGVELDDARFAQRLARACFAGGLVLNWTLHRDQVLRLAPPLVIGEAEIERGLEILSQAIAEAAA
ncbi:MAG: aminotransferase class III-fold pyridoxal phosphate-dependent enzyme [Deltaproteobacteria bacterium]|nr:aminotransferase class III-fold pyridoxal phosphate-dependent enzyme [Deltaproteobacteria bacterium]